MNHNLGLSINSLPKNSLSPANLSTKQQFFFSALFFVTVATTIFFPLVPEFFVPRGKQEHFVYLALAWMSTSHVALTLFFFADSPFREHMAEHRSRYLMFPIIVIIAAILFHHFFSSHAAYFWQFFHAWLLWHYMKQNLGIFSLVASKVDKKPASSPEKTIIYLSGLAGIVGSMRFKIDATFLAAYADEIFVFSKFLIGIAFTGLLLIIFTSWKNGKISIKRQMFLAACTLFFLPTFLANTYFPAVTSYAFAHGLQYWLFMGFLAYGNQKSIRKGAYKLALLGTLTVGGWSLIYFSRIADLWGPWASAIGGLGFGVTMAHFIVDADAWRMRESFQRNYISTRLF